MKTPGVRGLLEAHQARAVPWLFDRPRALLADDVGLGKPVTIFGLIEMLRSLGQLVSGPGRAAVIVVTDAALLEQWRSEFRRFMPALTVVTSADAAVRQPAKFDKAYPDGVDVLLVSYQMAASRPEQFIGYRPELVVLDEIMAGQGRQGHLRRPPAAHGATRGAGHRPDRDPAGGLPGGDLARHGSDPRPGAVVPASSTRTGSSSGVRGTRTSPPASPPVTP